MKKLIAVTACAIAMTAITGGAQAASYNLDFVAAAAGDERSVEGQTLSFGGLDVTLTSSHLAYLDDLSGGRPAGLGVCKVLNGAGKCNPGDDDNITTGESVTLSFGKAVTLSGFQFYNDNHFSLSASAAQLSINGDLYSFAEATGATFLNLTSITFAHAGGGTAQDFYLGGVSDVAPVPLPAALPLLLAAFGAMGFAARRRAAA